MHVAFCLVNFQEYRVRTMESRIAGVTGSDDGKLDHRGIGFGQWKAGSQEYRVRTMESRIACVDGRFGFFPKAVIKMIWIAVPN